MMPYISFNALPYSTVLPFLLMVMCLRYISGAILFKISAKFPLRRKTTLSSSFLILVCMKAFRMSITETSLSYVASIVDISNTDLCAAVGDAASSLSMVPRCLLPPETIRPLIDSLRFCFRNRIDSNTFSYSFLDRER